MFPNNPNNPDKEKEQGASAVSPAPASPGTFNWSKREKQGAKYPFTSKIAVGNRTDVKTMLSKVDTNAKYYTWSRDSDDLLVTAEGIDKINEDSSGSVTYTGNKTTWTRGEDRKYYSQALNEELSETFKRIKDLPQVTRKGNVLVVDKMSDAVKIDDAIYSYPPSFSITWEWRDGRVGEEGWMAIPGLYSSPIPKGIKITDIVARIRSRAEVEESDRIEFTHHNDKDGNTILVVKNTVEATRKMNMVLAGVAFLYGRVVTDASSKLAWVINPNGTCQIQIKVGQQCSDLKNILDSHLGKGSGAKLVNNSDGISYTLTVNDQEGAAKIADAYYPFWVKALQSAIDNWRVSAQVSDYPYYGIFKLPAELVVQIKTRSDVSIEPAKNQGSFILRAKTFDAMKASNDLIISAKKPAEEKAQTVSTTSTSAVAVTTDSILPKRTTVPTPLPPGWVLSRNSKYPYRYGPFKTDEKEISIQPTIKKLIAEGTIKEGDDIIIIPDKVEGMWLMRVKTDEVMIQLSPVVGAPLPAGWVVAKNKSNEAEYHFDSLTLEQIVRLKVLLPQEKGSINYNISEETRQLVVARKSDVLTLDGLLKMIDDQFNQRPMSSTSEKTKSPTPPRTATPPQRHSLVVEEVNRSKKDSKENTVEISAPDRMICMSISDDKFDWPSRKEGLKIMELFENFPQDNNLDIKDLAKALTGFAIYSKIYEGLDSKKITWTTKGKDSVSHQPDSRFLMSMLNNKEIIEEILGQPAQIKFIADHKKEIIDWVEKNMPDQFAQHKIDEFIDRLAKPPVAARSSPAP